MNLVGPRGWCLCLSLVVTALFVFLVHSGTGCLSCCLAHRCCRALPQVSRGAHEMLSFVSTALRCVSWARFVLCGPLEFLAAWPVTGLTSFCSVLQYVAAQCPQVVHLWLDTWERAMRASAK